MSSPALDGVHAAEVLTLLDDLAARKDNLSSLEDSTRKEMLAKAQALVSSLETPMEWTLRTMWAEPTRNAAIRIAIDLGIFERLVEGGTSGVTCKELASVTKTDPLLLGRVLKHLASMSIIKEIDIDSYTFTRLSKALAEPKYRGGVIYCFDMGHPSLVKLPSYFATHGYRNPDSANLGPMNYAHNTESSCFEWIKERPNILEAFQYHMSSYNEGRPHWADEGLYPVEERLKGVPENEVLLVDVGGATGHDLQMFKAKCPHLKGRLILQDLDETIDQISQSHPGIEATRHDFFTPQPVKGAQAYYMHSVLHDWNDENCQKILAQITPVMKRGYSKILIHENVVPIVGAPWQMTSLDWFMMGVTNNSERTETQWKELLGSVGLKINGIWTKDADAASLIEAVLGEA